MRQPKSPHQKRKPRLSPNKFQAYGRDTLTQQLDGVCVFTKLIPLLCTTKERIILFCKKKIPLSLLMKFVWHIYSITHQAKYQVKTIKNAVNKPRFFL